MFTRKKYLIKILPFFIVFLSGCATVPSGPGYRTTLKEACDHSSIQWEFDSVSQVITLWKGERQARAMVGSKVVVLGEEKITLNAPLVREENILFVPAEFTEKVINRLLVKTAFKGAYKVLIDAGHGGKDPGAIGRLGLEEKKIILDIAKRLKDALEARGIAAQLTRAQDVFLTLEERTEIASRSNADLFVSIHANSSPKRSVRGAEVFVARELDYSERKEYQRLKNHRIMFDRLAMKQGDATLNGIVSDMLYNNKRGESVMAATYVGKALCRIDSVRDRGTKQSGFFVLRNTLIPAILVEVGFLSNTKEAHLLKNGSYRQEIADSVADGITEYAAR